MSAPAAPGRAKGRTVPPRGRAASARQPHVLAGVALTVSAAACFAALDTTTKWVSSSVPLLMALWFRYAFQAVATTAIVLPTRGLSVWRTQHPKFQVLRGVLLLACSFFAFASLKYMPVGEFTAIVMIAPLAITVLAATVLHEWVSPMRWLLVAGGFAGTLIIIRRTLIASLSLPFVWTQLTDGRLWLALCFMGATATIGHFLLILGYQRAPASTLTPYLYAQIAFGMLGGWVVFSHVPDGWSLTGIALIAVCGAAGAWLTVRQSRAALAPAKA